MSKFSRRWSLKLDFDATVFFTLRFDDFFGSDSKTWSSNGASSRDFSRQIKIAQNIKIFVDNFHDFFSRFFVSNHKVIFDIRFDRENATIAWKLLLIFRWISLFLHYRRCASVKQSGLNLNGLKQLKRARLRALRLLRLSCTNWTQLELFADTNRQNRLAGCSALSRRHSQHYSTG